MDFLTADKIDPDALLDGANDAFSDYTLPTPPMARAAWDDMLLQRGFDASLSWVAMDGGAVEAYWLVGTETEAQPSESYGISVGTRPRARRQGLSRQLWQHVAGRLRDRGYAGHVLEVIETNTRAVLLYEGLGFTAQRRVECFKGNAPVAAPPQEIAFRDVEIEEAEALGVPWREWQPTWQNDIAAARNQRQTMTATVAFQGDEAVGFGYCHRPYGLIAQVAVRLDFRRRGIARALIAHWARAHGTEVMAALNIPDTDKASLALFRALGWQNHVNQFEMRAAL